MPDIGVLSPEQMRLVWQTVQQLLQSGLLNARTRKPAMVPGVHRVFVRNDSGITVPPFGCMQINGTDEYEGKTVLVASLPDGPCGEYVFNSEFEIEPDGAGWAYAFGQVRMLGTFSGFEACKRYAPQQGQWEVTEGPGPFLVYGEDSSYEGALRGRIVGDHCLARYITFDFQTGEDNNEVTPTDSWDGPDPADCGMTTVSVEYPLGEPLCDCTVVAVYDPNTSVYKAIATESAMMGEPVLQEVLTSLANDDCGVEIGKLEVKLFPNSCNPTPTTETIELGTETPLVVSIASDACGKISYAVQPARVFICGNTIDTVELPLNFDGVSFVTGAEFGPPDCGGAVYKWLYVSALWQWVLQSGCDCGTHTPPTDPGTFDGEEVTRPCTAPANSLCGLNLTLATICADTGSYGYTPTTVHVPLPLQAREVVTDVVDSGVVGDPIEIHYETIYVCNYSDARVDYLSEENCPGGSSGG